MSQTILLPIGPEVSAKEYSSAAASSVMKSLASRIGMVTVLLLVAGCASTRPITVGIARDGALTVGGRRCPASQLVARLSELDSRHHRGVLIRADRDAPFGQVVAVTDACEAAGVHPVTVVTRK